MQKGSLKKIDKKVIRVPEAEMSAFFDRLYTFAREADMEVIPINDHGARIEFVNSSHHTEIFDGAIPCREDDSLIHQIGMMNMAHEEGPY